MANINCVFRKFRILLNSDEEVDIYCNDWSYHGYADDIGDDFISFDLYDSNEDLYYIVSIFLVKDIKKVSEYCRRSINDNDMSYLNTLYERK